MTITKEFTTAGWFAKRFPFTAEIPVQPAISRPSLGAERYSLVPALVARTACHELLYRRYYGAGIEI
jgi:hypothetical protein